MIYLLIHSDHPFTFWSSTGSNTQEAQEYLIYELREISIVTHVELLPYQACLQQRYLV
jgi:hypothetical protein